MLDHIGVNVSDYESAKAFYVAALAPLGYQLAFEPIASVGGWGVSGFVRVQNLTDKKYIGSAFLNPDLVGGSPAAFEPGLPRTFVFSLSLGRRR